MQETGKQRRWCGGNIQMLRTPVRRKIESRPARRGPGEDENNEDTETTTRRA
jgi:hypothetical protein